MGSEGLAALGVAAAVGGTTLRRKCSPYTTHNSTSEAVFLPCLNVDSCRSGTRQKRALVAIPEIPPDWCLVQRTGHCERGLPMPTDRAFAADLESALTPAAAQPLRAQLHPTCVRSSPACTFISSGCFSEMRTGALLLFVLPSTLVAVFQCPSDGHHVDPESCASFYMCANGRVIIDF